MGHRYTERALLAGNQTGKSTIGCVETTYHLIGEYPDWWRGHRFDKPIKAWVAGPNGRKVREVLQKNLMGRRGRWGTGYIPRANLASEPVMARGTPGLVDFVDVRHASGGTSTLQFMSYDMDQDAWASDQVHLIHYDEEPPAGHYTEGLARFTTTGGICYLTLTPLNGATEVVSWFWPSPSTPQRHLVMMGLRDATHIPVERHEALLLRYPEHERRARADGIPILGSGLVFPQDESEIIHEPFEIPRWWPHLVSIDLGGGNSPTAFVKWRIDTEQNRAFIVDVYKQVNTLISVHASEIRRRAPGVPVAWPHDGHIENRGDGRTYAQMYRDEGCNMLPMHSQFEDGTFNVEPGIQLVNEMLSTGRLKVFSHCADWFTEKRAYHRKEGKIVKFNDHLMDATRVGAMSLRFADRPSSEAGGASLQTEAGVDYSPIYGFRGA